MGHGDFVIRADLWYENNFEHRFELTCLFLHETSITKTKGSVTQPRPELACTHVLAVEDVYGSGISNRQALIA